MPRSQPPPLPASRMGVVEAAWAKAANGADSVSLDELFASYDATRHPRVLDGNMAIGQAREILAKQFDSVPDGRVTWNEFLQYHVKISNEVERSRSVDADGTFVSIVVQSWKLDKDPNTALQPTGIVPVTLECPTGLKRTKNMDIIFAYDSTLATTGSSASASMSGSGTLGRSPLGTQPTFWTFKGVVKTRFARKVLPESIRGFFAFQEELTEYVVKPFNARSALVAPLSLVWRHESGDVVGFRDIISPTVDPNVLPQELADVVMPYDAAEARYGKVEWLPLEETYNPAYKKSSEAFGHGAQSSAEQVLDLKRKVFEGNNCGLAWYGHTGKFTETFNGGPFRASGLNTAGK